MIIISFFCRLFSSSFFGDKIATSSKIVIGIYPLIARPLEHDINRVNKNFASYASVRFRKC